MVRRRSLNVISFQVLQKILDDGKPFPPPDGLLINGSPNSTKLTGITGNPSSTELTWCISLSSFLFVPGFSYN